jgi:hypothetical protein
MFGQLGVTASPFTGKTLHIYSYTARPFEDKAYLLWRPSRLISFVS